MHILAHIMGAHVHTRAGLFFDRLPYREALYDSLWIQSIPLKFSNLSLSMTEQAETTKSSVPNIIEFHSSALLPNKQKQILPSYMYDRDIKNREREKKEERRKEKK